MGVRFKALMNKKGAIVQFVTKKAAIRTCKNGTRIAPGHVLTKIDAMSTLTLDLKAIIEKFNQHTLSRKSFVLHFVTDMTKIATKRSTRRRAARRRLAASSKAVNAMAYRRRSGRIVKAAELPKRSPEQLFKKPSPLPENLNWKGEDVPMTPTPAAAPPDGQTPKAPPMTPAPMTPMTPGQNEFGKSVMKEVKRVNTLNAQLRMQLRLANQQIAALQKRLKEEVERDKDRVEAHLSETQDMVETIEHMHTAMHTLLEKHQRNSDSKEEQLDVCRATIDHLKQELAGRMASASDINQLTMQLSDANREASVWQRKAEQVKTESGNLKGEQKQTIRDLKTLLAEKDTEIERCERGLKAMQARMPSQVQSEVRARTIEIEERYQLADESRLNMYMGAGRYLETVSRLRALSAMKTGTPATKVAFTSDKTQHRYLRLSVDETKMEWSSGRDRGKVSSIAIDLVEEVCYGSSERLLASAALMGFSPWSCFSFRTASRTYDFLIVDEFVALHFVHGLECLRFENGNAGGAARRLGKLLWMKARMKLTEAAKKDSTTKRTALKTRILRASESFEPESILITTSGRI